jgi:1-deoxy-D-xylulose-5-phosphate reductoisomerase
VQNIIIFGSTGSIGKSTLDVIRLHKDKYNVFALSGNSNLELLFAQCQEFLPEFVWIKQVEKAATLKQLLNEAKIKTKVLNTTGQLAELAAHPDAQIIMSAIVGSAGLIPTYHAAKSGKKILLANKESLVAGGAIITDTVKENNAQLIPVDSEHSAIYQALPFGYTSLQKAGVNKIILTASGGPFLNTPKEQLKNVIAKEAIKHPNWSMGQKISVDSATLMNKGLELIEAQWLFNASYEQLEVIIHPQSIIHSMVEYIDSSIIAQLGTPDMKTPIAFALSSPQRIVSGSKKLNFLEINQLTFCKPDTDRFPCLQIALDSLKNSSKNAVIINAANEIAVAEYLKEKIGFYDIPNIIEKALKEFANTNIHKIDELLEFDNEIRKYCLQLS